ncbi:MAG: hypothetical protein MZV64_35445 [Ignavibacteriales bacterium]|nr:hypothetical protein [Ignavibacteriales bacterium]
MSPAWRRGKEMHQIARVGTTRFEGRCFVTGCRHVSGARYVPPRLRTSRERTEAASQDSDSRGKLDHRSGRRVHRRAGHEQGRADRCGDRSSPRAGGEHHARCMSGHYSRPDIFRCPVRRHRK